MGRPSVRPPAVTRSARWTARSCRSSVADSRRDDPVPSGPPPITFRPVQVVLHARHVRGTDVAVGEHPAVRVDRRDAGAQPGGGRTHQQVEDGRSRGRSARPGPRPACPRPEPADRPILLRRAVEQGLPEDHQQDSDAGCQQAVKRKEYRAVSFTAARLACVTSQTIGRRSNVFRQRLIAGCRMVARSRDDGLDAVVASSSAATGCARPRCASPRSASYPRAGRGSYRGVTTRELLRMSSQSRSNSFFGQMDGAFPARHFA